MTRHHFKTIRNLRSRGLLVYWAVLIGLVLILAAGNLHAQQTIIYTNNENNTGTITITAPTSPTTLEVDNSDTATQSGVISESGTAGAIAKTGSGTLILKGANSYTGTTTISAGTLTAQGAGARIESGIANVGDASGDNGTLLLSNGGQFLGTAIIGVNSGSSGTVIVSGVNADGKASTLYGGVILGSHGAGTLLIEDGGQVTANNACLVGLYAGSSGTLTVTGVNANGLASALYVPSEEDGLYLGGYFAGGGPTTANIEDGGQIIDSDAQLGDCTATVTGVNANGMASTWINSSFLDVDGNYGGTSPGSSLTIENGGVVSSPVVNLVGGYAALNLDSGGVLNTGSINALPIEGIPAEGSSVNFNGGILVATADSTNFISGFTAGDVTLASGGGTIDNNGYDITVSSPLSGVGALTSTGTGTLILSGSNTYTGTTTISGGTLALSGTGSIASSSGVNLTQSGATFDISAAKSGVQIQDLSGIAGSNVNLGSKLLTVGTANSTTFAGALDGTIGQLIKQGTGTLTLTGTSTYTGTTTINAGTLAVQGAGASINSSVYLGSKSGDNGTLLISNGGQVASIFAGEIGYGAGSSGTVTVTGVNANGTPSTWNVGEIDVGYHGSGTLLIQDGGQVTATEGVYVDLNGDSTGTVTVTGVNANGTPSTLNVPNDDGSIFYVGSIFGGATPAIVNVEDGGQIIAYATEVGRGTVTVSGVNANGMASTLSNTDRLYLDGSAFDGGTESVLTIQDGGVVSSSAVVIGGGLVALNLNSSGVLKTGSIYVDSEQGTPAEGSVINFNGGVLVATSDNTNFINDPQAGQTTLDSGGGTIDNGGHSITISAPLGGVGALTSTGTGFLILTGTSSNTYTGGTTISQGTLQFAQTTALPVTGTVSVHSGATLAVNAGGTGEFTNATSGNGSIGGVLSTDSFAAGSNFGIDTSNAGGSVTYSGNITNEGIGLVKLGTRTLILDGTNTYTGGTTINGGALSVSADANLGASTGGITFNGGALEVTGTGFSSGRAITLTGSGTFRIDGGTVDLTNSIAGPGSLAKTAAGTLVLSGANTYTGDTQVTVGTLIVAGSVISSVHVASGATLGGTGTTGAVTVDGGGNINLRNGSIGTLTVGGLSSGGSTASAFSFDIQTLSGTTTLDSINSTGALSLSGTTTISIGALSETGSLTKGVYTLITYTGAQQSLDNLNLSTTSLDGQVLRLGQVGDVISLLVGIDSTTYDLGATVSAPRVISGGTATVTATITNMGSGIDDSLNFTGLTTDGNFSGGTIPLSGSNLAIGATASGSATLAVGTRLGFTTVTATVTSVTNSTLTSTATLGTSVTSTVDVVADRVVTATSVGLGRVMVNQAVSGTSTLSTTGVDADYTRVTVGTTGPDGNGISATGGTNPVFNSGSVTDARNVGGSFSTTGSVSGTLTLVTTGEGLAGESPINVALTYTADPVAKRVVTDGAITNLGALHNGATFGAISNAFTTSGSHDTTTDVGVATASGIADSNGVSLSGGPTTFNGTSSSDTRTFGGTVVNAGGGAISGSFNLAVNSLENGGAGLAGEGAYNNVNVAYTAFVYTGQGVWNTNDGGSWGAVSATPANWVANGGAPGLDLNFAVTDTATFGSAVTSGTATVTLDGDSPSLKSITFNNSAASYNLAQGTGGSITLNGGAASATITDLAGSHSISAPVIFATDANVSVASGQQLTISGSISGAGSLTKQDDGTLILAGANSYTGGTSLNGGTIVLGNNAALGTGTLTTVDPTVVYMNGVTISNAINLTAATTLEVDNADTALQSGIISNSGPLSKTGPGAIILTGANTFSGGMTINAGTLAVGNSSALGTGDVSLIGGTLTTTSNNQVINIVGNYTQGANGTLLLNIYSATSYDSLNLTGNGTAQLNGKLAINLQGNFAPGSGLPYALITSNNPINGQFTSVTTNLPSVSGTLNYTTSVMVLLQNSFANLPGLVLTPNQQSVATYLDNVDRNITSPAFANLIGALNNASVNSQTLANSLGQLTPVNFGNFTSSTAFNNAAFSISQFDSYLTNHRAAGGGFVSSEGGLDYSGLTMINPNIDPGLQTIRSRLVAWSPAPSLGLLSDSSSLAVGGVDMKDMLAKDSGPTNLWNVFVNGSVVLAQDFSNPAAGIPYAHSTTGAAQIGADYKIMPHWLVGATVGYGHTYATLDSIGSNATVNTYSPGIYTSYSDKGWYANGIASYGFSSYSQNRNVSIPGFGGTAHSSPGGDQIVADLDGGYDFRKGNWTFGPTLGLGYTHLDVDGYNESGLPGANLNVASQQADSLRSRLGGQFSYAMKSGSTIFTPHFSASWQHEYFNQSRGITSQFSDVGAGSFVVNTANPSQNSVLAELGLDAQINKTITVFTDYSVQAGQSNYFGQSVQAGVKIGF